jgi:predicted DsbA family dithiol-disulfide isomerase
VPNTRRAHECTEYARSKGKIDPFHHHLIERYWSHQEDLHDWAVLEHAAVVAGLDPKEMRAEVEAGKWKQATDEGIASAHELGISAVPTFIVGNKFVIQGAQDARVFRQAFERLLSPLSPTPRGGEGRGEG